MGANSKIGWTNHTWNPWTGCQKISPGCEHCYAEAWSKRSGLVKWGPAGTRKRTSEANWEEPYRWDRAAKKLATPARVFCASLADFLEDREELIPWRADAIRAMKETRWLQWMILTKRPENAEKLLPREWFQCSGPKGNYLWPDNVWIGATVESQKYVVPRVHHLMQCPAPVRFLSCEPLLEEVSLRQALGLSIDWVIVGGESGPGARPFDVAWGEKIVNECRDAAVKCFFKQFGSRPYVEDDGARLAVRIRDEKGEDWTDWPERLKVREIPEGVLI